MDNSYIFILSPPYSGSTILWKLVATSDAVSALPTEGQYLPETKEIMGEAPWNPDRQLPWKKIKTIWESYWDVEKPLLLEKSPPDLMHTDEISDYFKPAYFLILVRNPYALCEGIIRRNERDTENAARFSIQLLRRQMQNAKNLENAISFTYKELANNPQQVSEKIEDFIPLIGHLDYNKQFKVHSIDGGIRRSIINLNQKKLDNLSPKQLRTINQVFEKRIHVLRYWGYELYTPPKDQAMRVIKSRTRVFLPTMRMRLTHKVKKLVRRQ